MSKKPTVSIITVCFNAADALRQTYDSLDQQNSEDLEWIVVDGASTDNSTTFLGGLSEPWIHWISEPDEGIYDAMNKGINLARGEFIWFLNCGDSLFDKNTIEHLVNRCRDFDIIFGEVIVNDSNGNPTGTRSEVTPHKLPTTLRKELFQWGMVVSHQAFVVRRSVTFSFDCRYKLSSDLDWMLKTLERNSRILKLDTLARIAPPGASNQMWYRSQWERLRILAKHFGLLKTLRNHVSIAIRRIGFARKNKQ